MAYQTFMRSCTFAAAATLLQDAGFADVTDVDVCRLSRVPWVWIKEGPRDFQTGSSIVDGRFLSAAAGHFDLAFREERLEIVELPEHLRSLGRRAMISIRSGTVPQPPGSERRSNSTAGHAVVVGREGDGWRVENMRWERSDAPAMWFWDDAELTSACRSGIVGHLATADRDSSDTAAVDLRRHTIDVVFPDYRAELLRLWTTPTPALEFRKLLPGMFDGFFLEGPGLMAAVGEQELSERLGVLRERVSRLLRPDVDVVHCETVCAPATLDAHLEAFDAMLRRGYDRARASRPN